MNLNCYDCKALIFTRNEMKKKQNEIALRQLSLFSAFMGMITGPYGPSTWTAAKSFCEARGQRIMTIDSQEEEHYVKENLNPTTEYKLFYSRKQYHSLVTHRNTNTHNFIQPADPCVDPSPLPNIVKHTDPVIISSIAVFCLVSLML